MTRKTAVEEVKADIRHDDEIGRLHISLGLAMRHAEQLDRGIKVLRDLLEFCQRRAGRAWAARYNIEDNAE